MTRQEFSAILTSAFGIGLLAGVLGGGCAGNHKGHADERRIAVEAGAAEWRIDGKTGEATFHYLKAAEK